MDSHMMNRPGRLYYMLEFNGLDASFVEVEEYCEDNLVQKEYIPAVTVTVISSLFESFKFDMLKAMVEDMTDTEKGQLRFSSISTSDPMNAGTTGNSSMST